ncbi:MAG: hypothetical protein LBM23_03240 [Propionibacteriaceae bacterium]|jgi:hypothetical protein|nr:hypothetical protein [Propionibacteriaceae bacterium]
MSDPAVSTVPTARGAVASGKPHWSTVASRAMIALVVFIVLCAGALIARTLTGSDSALLAIAGLVAGALGWGCLGIAIGAWLCREPAVAAAPVPALSTAPVSHQVASSAPQAPDSSSGATAPAPDEPAFDPLAGVGWIRASDVADGEMTWSNRAT